MGPSPLPTTAGCIKMPLGTEVSLGLRDIGPERGGLQLQFPLFPHLRPKCVLFKNLFGRSGLIFGRPFVERFAITPLSVLSVCNVGVPWPNGWMNHDETWRAGRHRPWPHCVRWGPSFHSPKGAQPPIFGPYLLLPNGCMDQDVTWYASLF